MNNANIASFLHILNNNKYLVIQFLRFDIFLNEVHLILQNYAETQLFW